MRFYRTNKKSITMISYSKFLEQAEELVSEGHDDQLKLLLCQIKWIDYLTTVSQKQVQWIFEIWYKEIFELTEYARIIKFDEGE